MLIILTKFHGCRANFRDFSLMANFWASSIFFGTHFICSILQQMRKIMVLKDNIFMILVLQQTKLLSAKIFIFIFKILGGLSSSFKANPKCYIFDIWICRYFYFCTPIFYLFNLTNFWRPDNLKRKLTVCRENFR